MWLPAPGRVPASSARGWLLCVWPVTSPAQWVGDAGPRPLGCAEAPGHSLAEWGLASAGLQRVNIPPTFGGVTKRMERGLARISGYIFIFYMLGRLIVEKSRRSVGSWGCGWDFTLGYTVWTWCCCDSSPASHGALTSFFQRRHPRRSWKCC